MGERILAGRVGTLVAPRADPSRAVLAGGVVLFVLPALARLARDVWTLEQGAQGPIILASGLWLLLREARGLRCEPPGWRRVLLLLVPALLGTVFCRVVGVLWAELVMTVATLACVGYALAGGRAMARLWFPILYLCFLIPPPFAVIAPLTYSRKLWLTSTSVHLLATLGYDAAFNGNTLYIDGYELRIADACAGLNSLVSLVTVGLLYVYLRHRLDWRYALVLVVLMLPIAMLANLTRIVLLMLAAHYGGAALAEGALHEMAGFVMFLVALLALIAANATLWPLRRMLARG